MGKIQVETWNNGQIVLIYGDAFNLANQFLKADSVDLIFTDPPYPKNFLYLYDKLGFVSNRFLKPEGFLIAWCGPYWKDKVMGFLNKHLEYFYDFILRHKGNTTVLWPKKVISGYKSLLCYKQKGSNAVPNTNVLGFFTGMGGDKRFHKWGQDINTSRYFIECFSLEGDLIVDFFVGGGTVPYVCKYINRRFIGFEKDQESFRIACQRIENIQVNKTDRINLNQKSIFDEINLFNKETLLRYQNKK